MRGREGKTWVKGIGGCLNEIRPAHIARRVFLQVALRLYRGAAKPWPGAMMAPTKLLATITWVQDKDPTHVQEMGGGKKEGLYKGSPPRRTTTNSPREHPSTLLKTLPLNILGPNHQKYPRKSTALSHMMAENPPVSIRNGTYRACRTTSFDMHMTALPPEKSIGYTLVRHRYLAPEGWQVTISWLLRTRTVEIPTNLSQGYGSAEPRSRVCETHSQSIVIGQLRAAPTYPSVVQVSHQRHWRRRAYIQACSTHTHTCTHQTTPSQMERGCLPSHKIQYDTPFRCSV